MKYTCLQCHRTSSHPNLYCQEVDCPGERSPILMDYGDWLGDIEITRVVSILPASALYEAMHMGEKIYLKVAHPGREHTERLKREAIYLSRHPHPALPRLRPAYAGSTVKTDPYGKNMLGDHLLYFYQFDFWAGEPLRHILAQNPQLWINHVGWLTIGLAEAINTLHHRGYFHFGLTPEGVLVRFDEDEVRTPRLLLVDLGLISTPQTLQDDFYPFFTSPAYTAPEFIDPKFAAGHYTYTTDVYGVGLLLYEMLIGRPAFTSTRLSAEEVRRYVTDTPPRIHPMSRREDIPEVARIAEQAVSQRSQERQPDLATLARQLTALFGPIPEEKKPRTWPKTSTLLVAIVTLLSLAFLITLAVSLGEFIG